ncbi:MULTISPECIES: MarR family winged helix-turn-helix transcriptional regulator [Streptomyces]|uniref:MarR family winged helix-turn-helix transcriptional regulator n=1 Tax=Streptomyces TaxID=1883 RepID=UPI00076C805C|nr:MULTISPECIES: MarR family transcriptional regulator [Streptomyces]KUM76604.1 transcriptional regulator [Streptomyces griseorubiginosus]TCR22188.1 DNA-binding MarR family transcriptional regulator [Streptomyces sp. BK205]
MTSSGKKAPDLTQAVPADDERRAAVLLRLFEAGREQSGATVMFHTAVAAKRGLNPTETKALDLLERHGPLTAKELAASTRLAPASVTGLVDRLEAKGLVRRVAHPTDKRRVLIEPDRDNLAELFAFFEEYARDIAAACEPFTTDELETVIRFLDVMTDQQRQAAARLAD